MALETILPVPKSVGDGTASRGSRSVVRQLAASFKAHMIFFVLVGVYWLLISQFTQALPSDLSTEFTSMVLSIFTFTLPLLLLALVTLRFLHLALYVKPDRPLAALVRDLKNFLITEGRIINGLPILLAMLVFIRCFTHMKIYLPHINPFSWDVAFMELDRWLHFGWHPWEILQPVLGYPVVTFAINITYNMWFMVMWIVWVWQAFADRPSVLRTQFFLSFALIWAVGGNLLAIVFSSAGPAFYGPLGLSPDPFAPLMGYLYEVHETFPIWALPTQEALWSHYDTGEGSIAGISAMPSMHNAAAVLMALLGWQTSRRAGISLSIFAFFILIGSVHLGWHYAVDGYLGVVIAFVLWHVAGHIATWWHGTAWVSEPQTIDAPEEASAALHSNS